MNRLQLFPSSFQRIQPMSFVLKRAIALSCIGCTAFGLSWSPALANESSPDFSQAGRSDGDLRSGATRSAAYVDGDCSGSESLALLTPSSINGGYTMQANPSFWVYMPYNLSEDSPVIFSLIDESNNLIYETRLSIQDAGIHRIDLPNAVELQVGNTYEWFVQVYCNDPEQLDTPLFVSAWTTRLATDSISAPNPEMLGSPVDESDYYAEQLVWYDALSMLGNALMQENGDRPAVEAAWNELLELPSVQLDDLADEPLIDCCIEE